jgi:hypothetical protein
LIHDRTYNNALSDSVLVEKPEFVKKPEEQIIKDFTDVTTKVRAVGLPKPTLAWFRSGKQIDEKTLDEHTNQAKYKIETSGDTQVTSDFSMTHFGLKDVGEVIL